MLGKCFSSVDLHNVRLIFERRIPFYLLLLRPGFPSDFTDAMLQHVSLHLGGGDTEVADFSSAGGDYHGSSSSDFRTISATTDNTGASTSKYQTVLRYSCCSQGGISGSVAKMGNFPPWIYFRSKIAAELVLDSDFVFCSVSM